MAAIHWYSDVGGITANVIVSTPMPINNKFDLFASFSPEIRNSPKEHHKARVLPLVRWIENSRRCCRQRVFSVRCFELNPYDDTGLACKIVVTARTRRDFAGEHDLRQ